MSTRKGRKSTSKIIKKRRREKLAGRCIKSKTNRYRKKNEN